MAIKNSIAIAMKSGLNLPADNVFVVKVNIPQFQPIYDESGVYTGDVLMVITYDILPYVTEADITTKDKTSALGEMELVPSGWTKEMTPVEYAALLANGALAEVWLQDQIAIWTPGNVPTLINPY